jgi:hypothetical protein
MKTNSSNIPTLTNIGVLGVKRCETSRVTDGDGRGGDATEPNKLSKVFSFIKFRLVNTPAAGTSIDHKIHYIFEECARD